VEQRRQGERKGDRENTQSKEKLNDNINNFREQAYI
jgi:hypothetical protein